MFERQKYQQFGDTQLNQKISIKRVSLKLITLNFKLGKWYGKVLEQFICDLIQISVIEK